MKRLLWVAPYLVLLGSASGAADRAATQAADQAPLPVDKLVEEFQTNEVRAEALYTGKTIEVSGRVARVITARYGPPGQAGKDAYVVELRTKPLDLSRIAVHFYFDEAERDRAAADWRQLGQGSAGPSPGYRGATSQLQRFAAGLLWLVPLRLLLH